MRKLIETTPIRKDDYLKYWRSIYHYTKVKHNLTSGDIDMMLFLYSEPYFTVKKFEEFNRVLQLNRNRLNKMVDAGWIDMFRKGKARYAARYQLSRKATAVVATMYRQLNGGMTQESNSPLFAKKKQSYMDKRHAEQLAIRNETIRLQQRRIREE
tara:strand:+ start:1183 stop:1647 length:465 start_codon:yes stop_codon:yes gene_type:complete